MPFCKLLSVPMTNMQLASQFYNMEYSLHNGLKDHNMEVVQGNELGSKRIWLSVPPPCTPVTSFLPKMWENVATLFHGHHQFSANFDKAFIQCELVEDGTTHSISKLLSAPRLSSRKHPHLAEVSSEILNDCKHRKSAHSLLCHQAMLAKVESCLIQIVYNLILQMQRQGCRKWLS